MKILRLLLISILLVNLVSLTSCQKDDDPIDPRDQYVGKWESKETGSLTFYLDGQVYHTYPIDDEGFMKVTKSGEDYLIIGGLKFLVNGKHLSATEQSSETSGGVNAVGTWVYDGTLGSDIITINSSVTGNWNNSHGATGTFSGATVYTLTNKTIDEE